MSIKAAYAGVPGAFAHEACELMLPHHEPWPLGSFDDVVSAVANGEVYCGVLPLENSLVGPVPRIMALIESHGLRVAAETSLTIRLHLLGLRGCRIENVRNIVSHAMALRQCARKLEQLNVSLIEAPSTSHAASELAAMDTAALASMRAAQLYGLEILKHDMTDESDSCTTFGLIKRKWRSFEVG